MRGWKGSRLQSTEEPGSAPRLFYIDFIPDKEHLPLATMVDRANLSPGCHVPQPDRAIMTA
jgi:hypothetical protein